MIHDGVEITYVYDHGSENYTIVKRKNRMKYILQRFVLRSITVYLTERIISKLILKIINKYDKKVILLFIQGPFTDISSRQLKK